MASVVASETLRQLIILPPFLSLNQNTWRCMEGLGMIEDETLCLHVTVHPQGIVMPSCLIFIWFLLPFSQSIILAALANPWWLILTELYSYSLHVPGAYMKFQMLACMHHFSCTAQLG